ncbi:MAG: RtcB family protein [Synergistales bacterium]|nr:RtcB family protein [Synergistales bacterium]
MKDFLSRIGPCRWELSMEAQKGMHVPGLVYGDEYIIDRLEKEEALKQVANVACLPGITGYSYAMPDIHWGYGFPIGGVAAFDMEEGIISPGGVGYDISCGVRIMVSHLTEKEFQPFADKITAGIFAAVPCGVGSKGVMHLDEKELKRFLSDGAERAVDRGYGSREDLLSIEDRGRLENAGPERLSGRAIERGRDQMGTLGSGNHFVEVQVLDEIYDREVADLFDLHSGSVAVMIHCGSRGLGHQVCEDHIRIMSQAMAKYRIQVPDRQLCSVPLASPEADDYLASMKAAANFALANRQVIGARVRDVFQRYFPGVNLTLLYDVSHNMAHLETHCFRGKRKRFCVHRKGATRALPPGHEDLPVKYRKSGQPVIIPGSMGTCSYILTGTALGAEECFASTCHGAGRIMSRHAAKKTARGEDVRKELESMGIHVMAESYRTLSEESPRAYKDVERVVSVVAEAGISRIVARLKPLAVIKG